MRGHQRKLDQQHDGLFGDITMRRRLIAVIFCAGWLVMLAADAPKQITAEQRAKFWRAQAEYIAAQAQVQKAQATLSAIQAEMVKACGDQQLVADEQGEPACKPKPETPKK